MGDVTSPYEIATHVSAEVSALWATLAFKARMSQHLLVAVIDPRPSSELAADDAAYPWEKASAALRQNVAAAAEHGVMWANIVVPLQQCEGMEVRNPLRPYWTLARGGLEAASQAAWVLNSDHSKERVHRHLRLHYHDLRETETAMKKAGDAHAANIRTRMTTIGVRVSGLYTPASIKNDQPKYVRMLRETASSINVPADRLEVLWRVASAAAHGKNWFQLVAYRLDVGEEYEPGYHRTTLRPDAELFTEMMTAAIDMTHWAALRWVTRCGYDPEPLYQRALRDVAEQTPFKPEHEAQRTRLLDKYHVDDAIDQPNLERPVGPAASEGDSAAH